MRTLIVAVHVAALASFGTVALAQAPATDPDHAAHHPEGASAPAPSPKPPAAAPKNSAASRTAPDSTMKSMREMHDKMMAAKTPEERQALMADHMKAMQDGMAMMMMGQMKGQGGASPDAMSKRMDMMEMMMQMMMDREAARMPASR